MKKIQFFTRGIVEYAYFAQAKDGDPIKIGKSQDPRVRMFDLRRNGELIERLICTVKGSNFDRLEYRFHAYFEPYHMGNEWFHPVPQILDVVDEINSGTFDFGRLPERGWCITKPYQTKASIAHWGELRREVFA